MKPIKITKKKRDHNFISMFNGSGLDDPLATLIDSEEGQVDLANHEVSEILAALKEERKNRFERYRDANSPNFYIVLCFQSELQKEEFVSQAGWNNEPGSLYYDGVAIADQLEIRLTPAQLERKIGGKVTKKVSKMEVINANH